jgi:hypothetical protein
VERLEDLGLALLDFDTLTDLDNWLHPWLALFGINLAKTS